MTDKKEEDEFLTDDWTFTCSKCREECIVSWEEREKIADKKHGHET